MGSFRSGGVGEEAFLITVKASSGGELFDRHRAQNRSDVISSLS